MRIRSIRPEFWTSLDVAALPIADRLLFIGLWSYVDDNGVGRDVDALIASDLFPFDLANDARDTLARVSRGLARLSDGGQIVRYDVEGAPYLHVTSWTTHQRIDKPAKSRYPLPTCGNAVIRETVATLSRECREMSPPGEGEKGRRGEGEKGTLSRKRETDDAPPPDDEAPVLAELVEDDDADPDETADAWETFWAAYPVKKGKRTAEAAFRRACKRAGGPGPILEGMSRLAPEWVAKVERGERQYIAHPSTWLNRDGWEDEPTPPPSNPRGPLSRPLAPGVGSGPDLTARWREIAAQCDAAEAAR